MKKRRHKITWAILIFALALTVRIWNVVAIGDDFYANALSDASTYQVWAGKIVNGMTYGEAVFQMGPLYPYFLAMVSVLGLKFQMALYIQAILGAVVAVLVYSIARNIFEERAAIISGMVTALYAPFIFYDGLLLSESIQIVIVISALYLLSMRARKFSLIIAGAAGVLIGLAALGRATILIFAAALVVYWAIDFIQKRAGKERRANLKRMLAFTAGVLLGILPATWHNMAQGDLVLISSNTGINFYIGNNAISNGTYEEPKGLDLFSDFSGRQIAEKRLGRPLKSSEVSSFWIEEALGDIGRNPWRFAGGLVKKVWLYLWHYDIAQAESIHIQSYFSPIFKLPLFGFGAIFIFGIIGLVFQKTEDRRWILALLLLTNIAGVALFFSLGRFKLLGAIPLLISFGVGIMILAEEIRRRDIRRTAMLAVSALALLVLVMAPRPIDMRHKSALVYDNVGVYYYFKGNYDKAEEWYRRAAEISGNNSESMNNIGTIFYVRNMLDSATYYFQRSLAADSFSDKTLMNLGRVAMVRGMGDTARYYYQRAKEAAPFGTSAEEALAELERREAGLFSGQAGETSSFEALYERAQMHAGMGQYAQAEEFYVAALKLKSEDIAALNNLGFAYQAQKKYSDAAGVFERVLKLSPDNGVAYNNLAGTLYQVGKVDSAITLWEKAIGLDPSNEQFEKNLEFARKKWK
jgi:tetratricopeptide (TPR) repeat protein